MGFALGFAFADVAVEGAVDAGAVAAADFGASAAAADIGAGVAADVGAGLGAEAAGVGAADVGAGALGADVGTGALGADAGALGAGAAEAGGAGAALGTDFSALGAEGAAGAQGADIGALGAVSTPSAAPTGGLAGAATPAVPSTGGVVGPSGALDIGSQDVLSQAAPDLLGTNDAAALPANSQPASAFAGEQPGVGYNTPGVPDQFTGQAPASGIDAGVGPTGQAGGFLDTTQLPGQSLDFSQAAGEGALSPAGGADTGAAALQPGFGGPGSPATTAPLSGTTGIEGATFAGAQPAEAAVAAPPAATAPPATAAAPATATAPAAAATPASTGGAFGGTGWGWKAAGLGLAAAPLALTLAKGEAPLPPQASQVSGIAASQQAAAAPFIQSVIANNPTLSQAAQLNQQQQQLTNQWRQVLFNQGVQNPEADSRWPQIQGQIQQQMQIQTQQMIQSNLQAALGFSGAASNSLLQVANLQVQQDTAFTNAIAGATRALGTVAALGAVSGKG